MASNQEILNLVNCKIRFRAPEGEYEGVVNTVFPVPRVAMIERVILLPNCRLGTLNFNFKELGNIQVIDRPNSSTDRKPAEKKISPAYQKTELEKIINLDAGSDFESEEIDKKQEEYVIKIAPHLSKFVPQDFTVIDCINQDFNLAIKHIRNQEAIGVSLEGVKVSRSGILTWLCISTRSCNFLFDIHALGEQAFKRGLKSILENVKIQKIFHDCRLPSDCLFRKYGIRLVNVFDTQVADFIVMMQMVEKDKIDSRVNTLDACLSYYLEVPYDYLYGEANFNDEKHSSNFHALRPLQHFMQDVLIKNVMYLLLLKRELDLALNTPVRRATDVYLNSIQKLDEKELALVPHKPEELPLDMHLEGIQIFRYRDFEYLCSYVSSGPPYRTVANPVVNYLNSRAEYKSGQKKDSECVVNKLASENAKKSSSQLSCNSNGSRHKIDNSASETKLCGVNSLSRSSESIKEHSSDSEKSCIAVHTEAVRHSNVGNGDVSKSQDAITKCVTSKFNEPAVRKPSMLAALERMGKRSSETLKDVKSASNESNPLHRFDADVSKDNISVDRVVLRNISNINQQSSVKPSSNISDNDGTVTSGILRPTSGRMSPSEFLKLIPKMRAPRPINSDTFGAKHSIKDSIQTSASTEIRDASKKDDLSDAELEQMQARVRRRGAMLFNQEAESCSAENRSMSNPCAKLKSAETGGVSSDNLVPTSEDVNICYSDLMNKPSQFTVKVKRKSSRLADLYKQAGDANSLWDDEEPESIANKPKSSNCDDLWAKIRADLPCQPIDEKIRSRIIPAGMSGY